MSSFEQQFSLWEPHFEEYRRLLRYRHKGPQPRYIIGKVEKFWRYLRRRKILPQTLQSSHLEAYAQALKSGSLCIDVEHYRDSTVKTYLSVATLWSRHLYRRGFVLQEPLPDPRVSPSLRKVSSQAPLSKDQVQRILELPDLSKPWGLRDRAILEVIYGSGLRISEAASLTLESLDLDSRTLHLKNTKNNWDRCVPIARPAASFLLRYLQEARHHMQGPRTGTALWLTFHRRILQTETLTDLACNYSDQLDFKFTMHQLRHACATHLLEAGANIRLIAELLGHSDIESTGLYARAQLGELRKVHRRSHPRG